MQGTAYHRLIRLFDFSGGIQDASENPLAYPENALTDGRNSVVSNKALTTRLGYSILSSGSLPSGDVKFLGQFYFPTTQKTYLVAQVETGTGNKLYACKDQLPTTTASYTEIYE